MADSKARNDTFRYTVFVLSAVALVSGLILNNGAILQGTSPLPNCFSSFSSPETNLVSPPALDLMDNLSQSTLPGF